MKIKILVLTVFSLMLMVLPLYSNDDGNKRGDDGAAKKNAEAKRTVFYGDMETKIKFKKTDILAVRSAGYSPFFSMMMLFIAKEAGVPVSELIKMRADGKCWGDMCKVYNLDYASIADKFEAAILANSIKFPEMMDAEQKSDITYNKEAGR